MLSLSRTSLLCTTMTVLLFIQCVIGAAPPDECANPPRGQCTFYADCLESRYHCGASGYPLGYGTVFCNKFVAEEGILSRAGKHWMLDTMACLQKTLVPEATGAPGAAQSCDALQQKAFDSHPGCYVNSGLCSLSVFDWAKIVNIIGVQTLVGSLSALNETGRAAGSCLEKYAHWIYNHGEYLFPLRW